MSHSRPADEVLAGGGEMGALMRSVDWSKTAIGPVESWPQSLRTAVSILLETRFPMHISWGPEFVGLYNDGYRPILGSTKHPAAMGQSTRETFAEAWDIIGPMFEGVMQGRAVGLTDFLLPLDRHGFVEECYFIFSYSPIRDESGGVGGVLVTVTETTARVLGERRLRTLRDLAEYAGTVKEEEAAWTQASTILGTNPFDMPFTLLYRVDPDTDQPVLVGSTGVDAPPSPLLPAWPFAEAAQSRREQRVTDLNPHFAELPSGPWPEPLHSAMVLPVLRPGAEKPFGFLVSGVSARRPLDDDYRSFLSLVADHVGNAVNNARAHEEERRRMEALAELDRAKTAFFSNVSHEFRTPLTLMLGPIEESLTDAEQPLPPRQRERLQTVDRNSRRLLKLVNMLLDFSRIEAGRAQAQYQAVELGALTADLASSFRSLVEKAGLSFTVDCPRLETPVWVDREMYEKIVLNLISNAFKFTFEGGIRVSVEAEEGFAKLVVADTGTGIPEAELPRVFERFRRVEGARGRSYEGSGIGLSLVQELVKSHGGTITAESLLHQGSRFTVRIPFGTAHLPKERLESTGSAQNGPSGTTGTRAFLDEASQWLQPDSRELDPELAPPDQRVRGARILLADDNADMRRYIQRLLAAQGWEVQAVGDGEAALASIRARPPDVVLSDVMMPKLNGLGLLRAVKADEKTRSIPVILVSARAGEEASLEAMRQGADDYLVKPFSAKELTSRVASRLEIARARERLHAQFMQAPIAVCILSGPKLVFELANPRYLEMVGREDVVGQPIRAAFPELPDDSPVFCELERVYATGEPFHTEEFCVPIDRDGTGPENVFFKFTAQPVLDEGGRVNAVMVVAVDVTPQVEARQRVEALMTELQLADRRKDEFLAMLAHELRNPMAAISMSLVMLGRSGGDPERFRHFREIADRQMKNLVRLVDDLLDVSRITRGKVELVKQRIDLRAILDDATASTRSAIDARNHELTVTVAPGAYPLEADATRLEQVVTNLLSNAAKYTEMGGKISVHLSREGSGESERAVLRVRDTGQGIPQEMLDRVFDLFVQVNQSLERSFGGLGIGLTLVRSLVELHGGTVTARSDGSGMGSEFVVRLPMAATARPALPLETTAGEGERSQRRRVLVVEDTPDIREALKEVLEDDGHEVYLAVDGRDGVEKLLALKPDVALVDVGLPKLSGYDVAREVRASPGGDRLYLVALTGYGGAEARAEAQRAGFDEHLTKPVDIDVLPEVITRAERGRSSLR